MPPFLSPRRAAGAIALVATLAAGCSSNNGPGGDSPTSIAINAGNAQAVKYGTPVGIAPSVVVTNARGPLEGATVTFTVTAGGGTVTGSPTVTNAQGIATAGTWTLGPAPGTNTLRVAAGSISINIDAAAVSGPPTAISIVTGNNQTWVQGSLVPVAPSVVVTDGQFPVSGATVQFAVGSGGGSVTGATQTTSPNGRATVGGWRMGLTEANTATAAIQGSSIPVVTFSATAEPLVISALSKVSGDNQSGFAGNFADAKPTVSVLNQFGLPTEGVPVTFSVAGGGGTVPSTATNTGSTGTAPLPWWRYGSPGAQMVTASAGAAIPVTFSATANTVPISNYRINLSYPVVTGVTPPSDAVKAVFASAVERWQTIVVGGLTPITLTGSNVIGPTSINTGSPPNGIGVVPCIPQVSNTTIKDVNIYVYVRPIDGADGTNILGLATPIYERSGSFLPFAGCMIFDSANIDQLLASGKLFAVILHEMAHVLGFGTIWTDQGLLVGACPTSTKPWFNGPSSQQAFVAALLPGVIYGNPITPVEGDGACGDGTRDGHWSETVMGNELMTGFISPSTNPLSAITSASLRDMGYVVNDAVSDAYTVPGATAALRTGAAASGDRIHEMTADAPIIVTDSHGRTLQIIDR